MSIGSATNRIASLLLSDITEQWRRSDDMQASLASFKPFARYGLHNPQASPPIGFNPFARYHVRSVHATTQPSPSFSHTTPTSNNDDPAYSSCSESDAPSCPNNADATRRKRPTRAAYFGRLLNDSHFLSVCRTKCCEKQCCQNVLNVVNVEAAIRCTSELTQKEATILMYGDLYKWHERDEKGKLQFTFKFDHRPVCEKAYLLGHGYCDRQFRRCKCKIEQNIEDFFGTTAGLKSAAFDRKPIWLGVVAWLRNTAEAIGDRMPDREETRLPWPTRREVYENYKQELLDRDEKPASYTYFLAAWKTDAPTILTTKPHSPFSTCTECTKFALQLRKGGLSKSQREEIRAARKKHLEEQKRERMEYYVVRDLSLCASKSLPGTGLSCVRWAHADKPFLLFVFSTHPYFLSFSLRLFSLSVLSLSLCAVLCISLFLSSVLLRY